MLKFFLKYYDNILDRNERKITTINKTNSNSAQTYYLLLLIYAAIQKLFIVVFNTYLERDNSFPHC